MRVSLILPALALLVVPHAAEAACVNPGAADIDGVLDGLGIASTAINPVLMGDPSMFAELSELGPITPKDGGTMAFLFTGDVTQLCDMVDVDHGGDGLPDGDQAQVGLTLDVPTDAQSLIIDF